MAIDDYWYKNAVIYCLNVATYMDFNGDGIGDFEGLSRRLDYLSGLGVTCVWLQPFYCSPNRDNGYDVSDYYGVSPRFGTSGDFVEFMNHAQALGMRVVVDLVANHTSDQHPWFQRARGSELPVSRLVCLERQAPADACARHGVSAHAEDDLDTRPGRPQILFPPLLRVPARYQHP